MRLFKSFIFKLILEVLTFAIVGCIFGVLLVYMLEHI